MQKSVKEKKAKRSGKPHKYKWIWVLLIIAVVVIAVCKILPLIMSDDEPQVITVTESELDEVIKQSQLQTAEFPYNSYATVSDKNGKKKYYVAYNGYVKAGFDIEKVNTSIDDHKITVQLPPVVTESYVDAGTMEYIFLDDKYETETVAAEAYKAAKKDLESKAKDADIIKAATENEKETVRALIEPWVNQIYGDQKYSIEVLADGEEGAE